MGKFLKVHILFAIKQVYKFFIEKLLIIFEKGEEVLFSLTNRKCTFYPCCTLLLSFFSDTFIIILCSYYRAVSSYSQTQDGVDLTLKYSVFVYLYSVPCLTRSVTVLSRFPCSHMHVPW